MCGICGIASGARRRSTATGCGDGGDARPPRPRLRGHARRRRASGIAARRLAIIDLTGGDQPIANEDGTVRRRPERRDLQLPRARSTSSSARATASARTATPRCSSTSTRSGAPACGSGCAGCSRSRSGTRARGGSCSRATASGSSRSTTATVGGELAFASELDALPRGDDRPRRARGVPRVQLVPAPHSIFRDIRKLPPGHTLVWAERRRSRSSATRGPGRCPRRHDEDEAELVEECRARLRDSVRAHLIADVPVGVLLSGGVDSGVARRARRAGVGGSGAHVLDRLRGASLRRARRRARGRRALRTRTTASCALRPDAALLLPALAEAFDEPFADSSALPTYLVSQLAAEHVKVALSGEGGDELFGGYYTYAADLLAERVGAARRGLRGRSSSGCRRRREGELRLQGEAVRRARRTCRRSSAITAGRRSSPPTCAPSSPGARARFDPSSMHRARFAETEGARARSRGCRTSTSASTSSTTCSMKTDRASMAQSLEARVPFMDTVVDELRVLAAGASTRCAASRRSGCCARRSSRSLPREVVHGRKRGFSIPAAAWLRGELEPFARETLSPETLRRQGFFQPEAVTRLLDDARRRRARTVAPALGAARVHALARAPRRRHAAR